STKQAQVQAEAAHFGLQGALLRLQKLKEQLQNSSFVVELTNITVMETNGLMGQTQTAGGLLLYLASNNTVKHAHAFKTFTVKETHNDGTSLFLQRDFLSLELVEGHVRLTFDLGSGALIQTSNRKYNTGVWYKVTLQRNKRKGYLSIMAAGQSSEKEVLEAESPGTASDLNRYDLDPIYIGGFPFSRPIRSNVEIARSNFDLLKDAYGVRKGCVLKAVRSVSLLSGGFVQINSPSFSQEAELLFTFSSVNQSGVLLAAFSDDRAHRQVRSTQVSSSFPGCIRSVSLNGTTLDLSKPNSRDDVTFCFSKDQKGSYFNGSGHAELSESLNGFNQPAISCFVSSRTRGCVSAAVEKFFCLTAQSKGYAVWIRFALRC
ncbi:hypothetical protein XENOCAPTIV_016179, partial [Xenoophorus captivus]